MSDDIFKDDPNYDGQWKSREEETDGAMRAVACLVLLMIMVMIIVGVVVVAAIVL